MNPTICPSCGKATAAAHPLKTYRYRESGLSNVTLKGGVTETTCSSCKRKNIRIEKEQQLLQVIALDLLSVARPLTGYEMRFLRGACQMSQAALAEGLKRRRATVAEREARRGPPGISFADEVVLRWLLLKHFKQHISQAGNDCLGEEHREDLATFADFFDEFSKKYVEEALGRPRVVELQGDLWSLDKAA